MAPSADLDALIDAWCARDAAVAFLQADREVIATSRAVRRVIMNFARAGGGDEEIYDACAALGRLIAQHEGSPTLAASTMDHASAALSDVDPKWLGPARAAVVEGFTRWLLEKTRQDGDRNWEFPRCTVSLPDGCVAIAASHPSTEPEELAQWAARIANGLALKGVRRAFVAGSNPALQAVCDALDVVGVTLAGPTT